MCRILACLTLFGTLYIHKVEAVMGVTSSLLSVDGNTPGTDACYAPPVCDPTSRYRTANGSCNNLQNPNWGVANTPFLRLLPAEYSDGNYSIRQSSSGQPLPGVRTIRTTLFTDVYVADNVYSLALMQWGQVLTHDAMRVTNQVFTDCCDGLGMPATSSPGCMSIPIPASDSFYSSFGVTCQSYSRSHTTQTWGCNIPVTPQQQVTGVTQYVDLSITYGSDDTVANNLREFDNGRLREDTQFGEVTLPSVRGRRIPVCDSDELCFIAGDLRVNQNPDIGALSVMFLRLHNDLASRLKSLNPTWNDEMLYQESRRIAIAIYQHITYNEYLPGILAPEYITGMRLQPLTTGYTTYNNRINGGTINSFATAAWRTFHNTVQGHLQLFEENSGCPFQELRLSDWYWQSAITVVNNYNTLLRGLVTQPERIYSRYFTVEETNYFNRSGRPYGTDLESTDLTRGRDHGLPTYGYFRALCGLQPPASFTDLLDYMASDVVYQLSQLYEHVQDIDIFVGGTLETPVGGGKTGPTLQCIMAQQFARWKFGDRFFYEHGNQTGSFTSDQLQAIRRVSLATLMCSYTNVQSVQAAAFQIPSDSNPHLPCTQIPQLDITPWRAS